MVTGIKRGQERLSRARKSRIRRTICKNRWNASNFHGTFPSPGVPNFPFVRYNGATPVGGGGRFVRDTLRNFARLLASRRKNNLQPRMSVLGRRFGAVSTPKGDHPFYILSSSRSSLFPITTLYREAFLFSRCREVSVSGQ